MNLQSRAHREHADAVLSLSSNPVLDEEILLFWIPLNASAVLVEAAVLLVQRQAVSLVPVALRIVVLVDVILSRNALRRLPGVGNKGILFAFRQPDFLLVLVALQIPDNR